jgi:integrase
MELPIVRVGRALRFDKALLLQKFSGSIASGKSLKSERDFAMPSRYQRGMVSLRGKKLKMWYGIFREDERTPDGRIVRRQRNIRLGTMSELPTKNAARKKLSEMIDAPIQSVSITFDELAERWAAAEGPTLKESTLAHYQHALRTYVLPVFGVRKISKITREEIQKALADRARNSGKSVVHSMRAVMRLTLGWAADCGMIEKNPCIRVKLPQQLGGRTVTRTVLSAAQVNGLSAKLEEPYATLVLFLAASGLRIGEAIAVKWSDFEGNVLHVTRRIYEHTVGTVKSKASVRSLPIAPELVERMRKLKTAEWVFSSRVGTPIDPRNGLRRYVHPAARELGIKLGGWHDFRHTLITTMRRNGVHPRVISGVAGHSKVSLAMEVDDRTTVEDFRAPLENVAGQLLSSVIKSSVPA